VGWQKRVTQANIGITERFAVSLGVAGVVALGSVGADTALAAESFPQARMPSPGPRTTLLTRESVQVSLDLGDILQNVFRYVQVSTISDEEEVQIGREINRMLLDQQYRLYNDSQVQQYVDRIGQRLVAAGDSRDIPYTFQVVVSDNINAFATPGGYVYVTTGLLRAADNEAQLASVLAHEIAHINEHHSIEALKQAVLAQGIAETAGIEMNTLAQLGYQLAVNLPQSREFEYEADAEGLRILQAAGYPSSAFINFLEKLESAAGTPEFLQTHPTNINRIRELQEQIEASGGSGERGLNTAEYEAVIYPLN
jgi:predicted Zn-dependent protease